MKIRWDLSKNSATPPLSSDCWRLAFSDVAYFNTVANDKCYLMAFWETYPSLRHGPGIIVAPVEEVFQLRDEVLVVPYDLL